MCKRNLRLLVSLCTIVTFAFSNVTLTLQSNGNLDYDSDSDIYGFQFSQNGCVTGASGGDASLFNKTHTIATVPNTSHYTVTLSSSASTTSHSGLTLRRTISANTAYERLKMEDSETTYYITFEESIDGASSNGYVVVDH